MTMRYAAASSCISSLLAGAALLLAGLAPAAASPAGTPRLERVVMLMRHGVRTPTKSPPLPAGIAADPWPSWPARPGYLTPNGGEAVRLLGRADRKALAAAGLLPRTGCPLPGSVSVYSDSDQRTIATGDFWLAGLAKGCAAKHSHRPQDEPDPTFAGAGENGLDFDPVQVDAAVAAALGPGGIAAAEAGQRDALQRIDRIFCGRAKSACGVTGQPSSLVPAGPRKRPKLAGALDIGSTAAQILLLEHGDGRPAGEVGWGRASAADVEAVGSLHAAEFRILARPRYIAARNVGPIAARMLVALEPGGPPISAIVGHDTNVASLAGLLGLHWHVPGFAADDPVPGGAILFELWRDGRGGKSVRAVYRAQTLAQLRDRSASAPYRQAMAIEGCGTAEQGCPLGRFLAIMRGQIPGAGAPPARP